jgi:YegS/Rv2252/BmrU family lipid kinase
MQDSEGGWAERKEALVIVNPAAHNLPKERRILEAQEWLNSRGWTVMWVETQAPGDATAMAAGAAERGVPLVWVCGGDGTLNEAVNGLAGSQTALAVIPAGTVNLWARELRIHRKKPATAVQLAAEGERRLIDVGLAGDRYFLCMASYGIDAAVTAHVSHRLKGRLGAAAYAVASLREALRYRGTEMTLRMDSGEEIATQALMVIAANARQYAGLTQITPEAVVDDGLLDIRVFVGHGRLAIILHALRTLFRLHRGSRRVIYRRSSTLGLEWEAAPPLQLDGDFVPESPKSVRVVPGALWVALPKGLRGSLITGPPDR